MIGKKQMLTSASCQLYIKVITMEATMRQKASITEPSWAPVTVSRLDTSVANRAVSTPGWLAISSNHPGSCKDRMLLCTSNLDIFIRLPVWSLHWTTYSVFFVSVWHQPIPARYSFEIKIKWLSRMKQQFLFDMSEYVLQWVVLLDAEVPAVPSCLRWALLDQLFAFRLLLWKSTIWYKGTN